MNETIELPRERVVGNSVWTLREGTEQYVHFCGKCGGDGYIPVYGFNANGLCFRCNGAGRTGGIQSAAGLDALQAKFDKKEAAKERKRVRECIKRDERVEAFTVAEPVLAAVLKAEYDNFQNDERVNRFYLSLAEQLHNVVGGRDLSEKQIDALRDSVERAAAEKAAAVDVPDTEDRIAITGEVLSTKWAESDFGSSLKMVIKDDRGFKLYGSVPSNIDEPTKGTRVTFMATVEPGNEKGFGFFKRPTKAAVVA